MAEKKIFSLRYKLLALLILVPTLGLIGYALMAVSLFTKDKEAYILDSSVIISKSLSTQVKMDLDNLDKVTAQVIQGVDLKQFKFTEASHDAFMRQDRVEHILIFQKIKEDYYEKVDHMYLPKRSIQSFVPGGEVLDVVLKIAAETGYAMQELASAKRFFIVAQKIENTNKQHAIIVSVYNSPDLYESFASPSAYKNYLVSPSHIISMEPKYFRKKETPPQVASVDFFNPIFKNQFPVGVAEIKNNAGLDMLVSYAKVGKGGLVVASVIEKNVALKALETLKIKSGLYVLTLLTATVLIGVVASFGLTSSLRRLVGVTQEIATGKFNVSPNIRSNDEVQQLSESISFMAAEVSNLMKEVKENARLVGELETVKVVQDMLFPGGLAKIGSLEIAGYFQPASECGGDWWNYSVVGDEVYMWLGDATGHGAPAALLTSAAKAVSSVIELVPNMSPAAAMEVLNHAIYSTAKGKLHMTFFLAAVDMSTGFVKYASASHEFPFVLPQVPKLAKKDLHFLSDAGGKRLGENAAGKYTEGTYQMKPGDTIVMYTDGAPDLRNPNNEPLGEREFANKLIQAFGGKGALGSKLEVFKKGMAEFQGGAALPDDISLLVFKFDSAAEA